MPGAGQSILEALGSRVSIHPAGRLHLLRQGSLILNPMPPRITEKSYRQQYPDIPCVAARPGLRFGGIAFEEGDLVASLALVTGIPGWNETHTGLRGEKGK